MRVLLAVVVLVFGLSDQAEAEDAIVGSWELHVMCDSDETHNITSCLGYVSGEVVST
jgi:hypothetical protein